MHYFIINPKASSGKGIRYWWTVKSELDKSNVDYTAVFTRYAGYATKIAEQICQKTSGIKNIVVLGGDGTINEVINGIHNYKNVLLGYIPSGSSNDLARSLKISRNPLIALSHIMKPSRYQYLDHGIIEFMDSDIPPRKFSCSSGIGYDAAVCREVSLSPLKKKLNRYGAGKYIYYAIAIKQIFTMKHVNATVIVDGIKKYSFKNMLTISSMIHKYEGGGLMMAPDANPSDGKLSICLAHGLSKRKIVLLLPALYIGKHTIFKGIETFDCSSIEIMTDQPLAVHTDGEVPILSSHIKVNIVPDKIRMIL
jgi:YegS/Rv2252/BmrU family lipid kinase